MNPDLPLPPGSQRIVDLPGYPGGVNFLSDRDLRDEGINKSIQKAPNTSVNITVKSHSENGFGSAEAINISMLAFADVSKYDKPTIMSIGEVNSILHKRTFSNDKKDENFKANEATRDAIYEQYKLLGAVVNSDEGKRKNGNYSFGPEKRVFTITVSGDCHLYNYWTWINRKCMPYTKCYLILRPVKMRKSDFFMTKSSQTAFYGHV